MSTTHGQAGQARVFFAGLFDFGFTTFITLKFLRVIYTAMVALILLGGAALFLVTVSRGGIYGVLAMFVVPLVALFLLVLVRISLETVALFFRVGANTTLMAAAAGGGGSISGGTRSEPPGPYSGPAFPPSRPAPFAS
jgi:hypothetical protein